MEILNDDNELNYYYLVTEESVGFGDSYSPKLYFKKGNLLRRKHNALAYYNKRKETLTLNKFIITNSTNVQPYHKLKLFLIQNIDEGEELEYLLLDEFGVRNFNNYYFEIILLDYLGLVKQDSPYQHNPNIYLFMIDNKWIYQTHEQYYLSALGLQESKQINISILEIALEITILQDVSRRKKATALAAKAYLSDRGKYLGWLN